jgi:hypothetical protein
VKAKLAAVQRIVIQAIADDSLRTPSATWDDCGENTHTDTN